MLDIDLPATFAIALAFVIALYVVLDGFDLGVGILFPFAPRSSERDEMIGTLAPLWDGNETWLVLGGMLLLTAFPKAFAILLPAFYVPLALMLFALILRGISFGFRAQGGRLRIMWSAAFSVGSTLAAFCQGVVLGAFVGGEISVVNGAFAGGPFDWISPFSVLTGLGVCAGYSLLGACWLIWKTEGATQIFGRELAFTSLMLTGIAIGVVSLWTPFAVSSIAERWFAWPNLILLSPLPLFAVVAWVGVWRTIWARRDWLPFVCTVTLFLVSLGGLGASVWPNAVPGTMTIWDAASAARTQSILLISMAAILPIVLGYTAFSYWTFRGKYSAESPD